MVLAPQHERIHRSCQSRFGSNRAAVEEPEGVPGLRRQSAVYALANGFIRFKDIRPTLAIDPNFRGSGYAQGVELVDASATTAGCVTGMTSAVSRYKGACRRISCEYVSRWRRSVLPGYIFLTSNGNMTEVRQIRILRRLRSSLRPTLRYYAKALGNDTPLSRSRARLSDREG